MTQSHGIKGDTADEAFQARGAFPDANIDLFKFKIFYMQKKL